MKNIVIRQATGEDSVYAVQISEEMFTSAIARGSGISRRTPASLIDKMKAGKAIIALTNDNQWVGFSYLEVWANGEFVSNSGMIVSPGFRGRGVAKAIKKEIFLLSRRSYPDAKIFSITTGLAIMQMNAKLGFLPVTYSEIPGEQAFWKGCQSCVNYAILEGKKCSNCLCTAMLYTPQKKTKIKTKKVA